MQVSLAWGRTCGGASFLSAAALGVGCVASQSHLSAVQAAQARCGSFRHSPASYHREGRAEPWPDVVRLAKTQ
jgi:hypothetical protein